MKLSKLNKKGTIFHLTITFVLKQGQTKASSGHITRPPKKHYIFVIEHESLFYRFKNVSKHLLIFNINTDTSSKCAIPGKCEESILLCVN